MDINTFAGEIIEILRADPRFSSGTGFSVRHVTKAGDTELTGIVMTRNDGNASPCIYVDEWYKGMTSGYSVIDAATHIADTFAELPPVTGNTSFITNLKRTENRIVFKLSDGRQSVNGKYLKDRVSISVPDTDLVITFDVILFRNDNGVHSTAVTKDLAGIWNISPGEIWERAIVNTPLLRPARLDGLADTLNECCKSHLTDERIIPGTGNKERILTVAGNLYGAAAIFYPHVTDIISVIYPDGFILLPSSVHEWLIVPDTGQTDIGIFHKMVTDINRTAVTPEDRLADAVFTHRHGKFTQLTAREG